MSRQQKTPVHIRPACAADIDTIVQFQLAMAQETEGVKLDPPTVRLGVRGVFDVPSRGAYIIAECEGQVAGGLLTIPEWSDWRNGMVIWIHSVYIRPEFRRRGVFAALYEHLKKMVLSDVTLCCLRLYVDKRNQCAQRTYEALGMDGEHYQMYEWMK